MDPFHAAHATAALGVLCGTNDPAAFVGIVTGLFVTALAGSFAHCAPMCGPFVLMQVAGREREGTALQRLGAGALPGYQLGRMTTYVALGLVAGGLSGSLTTVAPFRWVAGALLGLAALSFLLPGLGGILPLLPAAQPSGLYGRLATALARLAVPALRQPGVRLSGYRLGLLLGLLPCGFLYAALVAAAATGNILA